jgi:DNA-binding transcriptional LysR family regulator
MRKLELAEMEAFVAVAERSSFAKAATDLGISRSFLSEVIRAVEEKLGVRLLNRTSRSVSMTETGERLFAQIKPLLERFAAVAESINEGRETPAGRVRLSVPRAAAKLIIEPVLARFLAAYPAISLEICVDNALTDIVREHFDAGIRLGSRVDRDMVAIRLASVRPAFVASPEYLAVHGQPRHPTDLGNHRCIHRRFGKSAPGPWLFVKRGKRLQLEVRGSLTVDDADLAVRAALDGVGIARVFSFHVAPLISQQRLVAVLEDWAPPASDHWRAFIIDRAAILSATLPSIVRNTQRINFPSTSFNSPRSSANRTSI